VGEDGGDGDVWVVTSDGNVDIGQAVVVAAGLVERGEGLGVAGEGAVGGVARWRGGERGRKMVRAWRRRVLLVMAKGGARGGAVSRNKPSCQDAQA
jgi:hypothetical protein